MTGEFSTLQHWIAGIMLARPGPSVPKHTAGLPVIRDGGFGHEPGGGFVVRRNHRPAARFGFKAQVDEVGIGDAEQGLDPLGLEQIEDALDRPGCRLP